MPKVEISTKKLAYLTDEITGDPHVIYPVSSGPDSTHFTETDLTLPADLLTGSFIS
jgi:hypothetical protein